MSAKPSHEAAPLGADVLDTLGKLRIGCVRYLNSRPLIEPYERAGGRVVLEHPAVLADQLRAGKLVVALIPVFEALRLGAGVAADGIGIAARGPVWSVILAHPGPLEVIEKVELDPASRTSVHLCKVFFAEWGKRVPLYLSAPADAAAQSDRLDATTARVIIGNQAIHFRLKNSTVPVLDFGEAWLQKTGLPFVFAVWMIRPEIANPAAVSGALRALARCGCGELDAIAARQTEFSKTFAFSYLSNHIRFGIGPAEKQGVERFRELLCKHGFLPPECPPLKFA
jgi:chorismate dehydratase